MGTAVVSASLICLLVFVHAATHVESRTSGSFHWYYPFVFGDSFADTGNLAKSNLSRDSRQWYSPYGISRLSGRPTGRFSDGFVQSDLLGRILGRSEAPVAYRVRGKDYAEASGVNFAVAGAETPNKAPTLAKQIHYFRKMVEGGTVTRWQLKNSVALVAISGSDYARMANTSTDDQILGFAGNVTDEIAKGVQRLQKLGVAKVLVNALHPLGCTPPRTRSSNYTDCDSGRGNTPSYYHNQKLREKLDPAHSNTVYVVDLYAAFSSIVNPSDSDTHPQVARKFTQKLKPCCESVDPASGYCGQVDEDGGAQYSVCSNPEKHFFWDDVHPTQAGWEAVMGQLERDIKDFLDISK